MESEQTTEVTLNRNQPSVWNRVTPFSKYLAMIFFVILLFIGGYVGYKFAPEKIVEVEKIIEAPVSRNTTLIGSNDYTWLSYSRLLRWENIESKRGAKGYGFLIEVPVTSELSKNYPSVSGSDALQFVYQDNGRSAGVVSIFLKEDDETDYTTDDYSKSTNNNGLTYYTYDSEYTGKTNILLSFPGIDNGNMTLLLLISDISIHLSDENVQRIIDSVAKTTEFDSGDI